jgi:hypothetical protein
MASHHLVCFDVFTQLTYDLTTSYVHHSEMNTLQHSDVIALHYVYTHIKRTYLLLHISQENRCSQLCITLCFFGVPLSLNDILHASHLYGQSPIVLVDASSDYTSYWET